MSPHNVVRRKSIRCGDPGNGKIRVDFAWGVEKVNFLRYFEGGGHKKGVFLGLIFSVSSGIRVPAPMYAKLAFFLRPHLGSLSGAALRLGLFLLPLAKPLVSKDFAKDDLHDQILRRESLPGGLAHVLTKNRPQILSILAYATSGREFSSPERHGENREKTQKTGRLEVASS